MLRLYSAAAFYMCNFYYVHRFVFCFVFLKMIDLDGKNLLILLCLFLALNACVCIMYALDLSLGALLVKNGPIRDDL